VPLVRLAEAVMSRSRLAWQLFAGSCGIVAVVMTACYWLASIRLATLADESQFRRMTDAATSLSGAMSVVGRPVDADIFSNIARELGRTAGIDLELLSTDGRRLDGTLEPAMEDGSQPGGIWPDAEMLLAEALAGRVSRASRFDAVTGSRVLAVAFPVGPREAPVAVIRVTSSTSRSDQELTATQRSLLAGYLLAGLAALLTAWGVAVRTARPARELARVATLVAGGDVDIPVPAPEVLELASLATALQLLRDQLVERGLMIGRQDTEQEAVLDSMIEGVLAVDGRQRIVGINQAAAQLLQLDIERVVQRPLQDVVRNPELRRFALRAIDCREPVEDDLILAGPTDRTIRVRGTALRDLSGEGGAVIVLNDVTDLQRLEAVRRDFVANVSHELKTPIASIKGFVESLLDGAAENPEDRQRFLEIVARQADRLAAIIEDLLALSRIEQSEKAGILPTEWTKVADVIMGVATDCLPRAADRSIRLEVDCPDTLEAEVNAPLLEQAVINLVDNAIKYSEDGRLISVAAARQGMDGSAGDLMISVADQGCGIEAEHLPRLFERFYRVDKGRSRRQGGTGLGLAIVKHIVQAHGGTISVESKPNAGSTFTIRLPQANG
jgi:two-component system phosphate regulon sensor histidine kinase PhoR